MNKTHEMKFLDPMSFYKRYYTPERSREILGAEQTYRTTEEEATRVAEAVYLNTDKLSGAEFSRENIEDALRTAFISGVNFQKQKTIKDLVNVINEYFEKAKE